MRLAGTTGGGVTGAMRTLAVALVLALVAGGCGHRPQSHTVALSGFGFHPDTVRAAAGDTVVFRNDDAVPHTATADAGGFDSGDLQPGKSWRWVTKPGRFAFHCTYHPNMTGLVAVQ